MINYAICEFGGKQYKVVPGQALEVDFLGEADKDATIEANVLLLSEDNKIKIGNPYLKEKLTLKRLGNGQGEKIRVSKFHAKANYRRTTGFRAKITKVVLTPKN